MTAFFSKEDSPIGCVARKMARMYNLPNVRFMGRRMDMPELYRASDAVLQPTLAENQSLVTLEAIASGLPVITTPIPAQRELIQDGVEGFLVPPRPHLFAKVLWRLSLDPALARRIGQAARARVLAAHTLDQTASHLATLLKGKEEGECASTG